MLKITDINPTILKLTLNVIGLSTPYKSKIFSEWMTKQNPSRIYL
jgi:hypothetical protein